MADYYKNAITEMVKQMNEDDLAFFYTLIEKTLRG